MSALRRAVALLVLAPACGGASNGVPQVLETEARTMAAVQPPVGWSPFGTIQRTDDQFERVIGGVTVVYAGDFRELDDVRATSAGVAWRSPVITSATERTDACRAAAELVARAGAGTGLDEQACATSPDDPDLRIDFVLSFWSEAVVVASGARTYGSGIHLDEVGDRRVVVSLAFGLTP